MLLIIDNYDSFTYNLVQYFQCLKQNVVVYTNDQISIEAIGILQPQRIVISPGPQGPQEAGISLGVIESFYEKIPILGVCLGHQCLAHCFGATIIQSPEIIHGKTSAIYHNKRGLFRDLPTPFQATRYHSLAVAPALLPSCLAIDAWADNIIMAISHRHYPLYGLQFHPEAILSEYGFEILRNFLETNEPS